MKTEPKILRRRTVTRSRLFRVDAVELEFSNGRQREFEQLVAGCDGGVVVMPVTKDGNLVMIEEFALGTGRYELGFVKGVIESGESPHAAALRELREETGFGARQLCLLETVTLMPAYSDFRSNLFLANDLYVSPLDGDEPEPLTPFFWPLERIDELHRDPRITDARTRLALFLIVSHLMLSQSTGTLAT